MILGYTVVKKLGGGSFAKVKLAINDETGDYVAVKIIKKQASTGVSEKKFITREINMLRCLNHPNIVKYVDMIEDDFSYYIIMEYVDGKQLFDKVLYVDSDSDNESMSTEKSDVLSMSSSDIEKLSEKAASISFSSDISNATHRNDVSLTMLSEKRVRRYFFQLISAIGHCHANFIAHRDLKLENILINKTNEVKLIDFGFADFMRTGRRTFCGSMYYVSPEILKGDGDYSSVKSDIWALGIILYAMFTGRLPFGGKNDNQTSKRIIEQEFHPPPYLPRGAADLISLMLVKNPSDRISLTGIRNHPWMQNVRHDMIKALNLGVFMDTTPRFIDNKIIDKMIKIGYNDMEILAAIRKCENNECLAVYHALCEKYNVYKIAEMMIAKLNGDGFHSGESLDDSISPDMPRKMTKSMRTASQNSLRTSPMLGRLFRSRKSVN